MAENARATGGRMGSLDFLRFIAAGLVMLYHFCSLSGLHQWRQATTAFAGLRPVTNYGYLGVQLFFLISGYVILLTAWRRDVAGFVASRVARLFPAYLPAVVLATAVGLALPGGDGRPLLSKILANGTMMQASRGVMDLDGAYWTLWTELRFYVLMAILIAIGLTRTRVMIFAFMWPLLGSIAHSTQMPFFDTLLVGDWAPFFAAGMMLYLANRDGWSFAPVAIMAVNLCLGMSEVTRTAIFVNQQYGIPVGANKAVVICLVFFGLVVAATKGPLAQLRSPFLSWCGALTYPLYLIHSEVLILVIALFKPTGPAWVMLGAMLALSVGLAIALHQLCEKPFAKPLQRKVEESLRQAIAADAT